MVDADVRRRCESDDARATPTVNEKCCTIVIVFNRQNQNELFVGCVCLYFRASVFSMSVVSVCACMRERGMRVLVIEKCYSAQNTSKP